METLLKKKKIKILIRIKKIQALVKYYKKWKFY